jgi:hypothetical protein
MTQIKNSGDLSPPLCRLVRLMQSINFGWIASLRIRNGEPVLDGPFTVVREHKFGGHNGATPQASLEHFALKPQVVEMVQKISTLQDAVIDRLEVQHGLPFRLIMTESQKLAS